MILLFVQKLRHVMNVMCDVIDDNDDTKNLMT